jgi:hypothetical protein
MAAEMQMNSGCLQEACAVSSSHLRPSLNVNQRRSQRILLTVPIEVSGISSNNAVFSERTSTLVVNAHGALIQLRERVVAGQKLRTRNATTKEEISCAMMDINTWEHCDSRSGRGILHSESTLLARIIPSRGLDATQSRGASQVTGARGERFTGGQEIKFVF